MNIFTKSVNGTSPSSSNATISSMVGFKIIKDTTVGGNMVTSGILKTTATNFSASSTTGALIVGGGAGINGNIYVGGTHNRFSQFSSTIRGIQFGIQSFGGIGAPVNITFSPAFPSGSNVMITLGVEGDMPSTHFYGSSISNKSNTGFTLNPYLITIGGGVSNNGGYTINWCAICY